MTKYTILNYKKQNLNIFLKKMNNYERKRVRNQTIQRKYRILITAAIFLKHCFITL